MIVYREQRQRVSTTEFLPQIESAQGFDRQMKLGQFEAGVADALFPECDRDLPVFTALPREIEISVPEGFAYYALDPELYERAAVRFVEVERPEKVSVIGIRAIGTTLSKIVAATLRDAGCQVKTWTVRPRGHPWNRELCIDETLAQGWRQWPGSFAVVDEGPGLSGSSFAAVSVCLESLGVAPERVIFFPSWVPDGSGFLSERARARWLLHRKYCTQFGDLGLFPGAGDIGAGNWRSLTHLEVAAQPQHERRKYLDGIPLPYGRGSETFLSRDRQGAVARLYKFAGYGSYGQRALDRAEALRGWIPSCGELSRGFLSMQWISGQPPQTRERFLNHAARYLAHVRREFPASGPVRFDSLAAMIAENAPHAPQMTEWRSAVLDGCAVHLDARMFPHEWIDTSSGFLKTDALDHHDDHFFPGPQDTAWDVAGTIIEFQLDAAAADYFLECYERASGDRCVRARLPFYRLAYLAFRFGYCDLAMHSLQGTKDGVRFRRERARYETLLKTPHG